MVIIHMYSLISILDTVDTSQQTWTMSIRSWHYVYIKT